MKYTYDPQDILHYFETLVNIPSPVGYYVQMNPVIEKLAEEMGENVWYDNKSTAYITLEVYHMEEKYRKLREFLLLLLLLLVVVYASVGYHPE